MSRQNAQGGQPTAVVITLGCKVNQYESSGLENRLAQAGYRLVEPGQPADLTVLNTCTVTHRADQEARSIIRRSHRLNPAGRIVVTGCLVQTRPETVAELPGVSLILGQDDKDRLVELLDAPPQNPLEPPGPGLPKAPVKSWGFPLPRRTRVFFRIQDGCSSWCAYCAVPAARGPSRSMNMDEVLGGLAFYHAQGYREVVLTGIHLGAWGLDLTPRSDFFDLLSRALETPGPRLRISSIEPHEVDERLVRLITSNPRRVCAHLHLPLQSGDDEILKRMGRPYATAFFSELVHTLKRLAPHTCLGVDVMTGFPGETEVSFLRTHAFLESLPISYLHVFGFSPRPEARASGFSGQVPPEDIKRRTAALRKMGRAKRLAFFRQNLGSSRPTLIENTPDRKTGEPRGLTDNYIQVLLPGQNPTPGLITPARLTRLEEKSLVMLGQAEAGR